MQSNQPNQDIAIQNALRQAQSTLNHKIKPEEIVVCSKCNGEFFFTSVRLAKSKMDLVNEAVGMIHEQPHLFCIQCGTMLSKSVKEILCKKDLKEPEAQPQPQPTTQENTQLENPSEPTTTEQQ